MNHFFSSLCSISSIIVAIVCMVTLSGVYAYASLLPIFFFIFLRSVVLTKNIWSCRPLTSYIITTMLWIRMVLLPLYGAVSGVYSDAGSSLELENHFVGALFLCIYDCVAVVITLFFFSTKNDQTARSYITQGLYGNKDIYLVFVVFAFVVFFTVGRSMHLFDFIIKPIGEDLERAGDLVGGRELVVRQIASFGLLFVFLLVVGWLKNKYDRTGASKYFQWSLICAVLFIAIIAGERRSSQIYKAFASGYVLLSLYPSKGKKTVSFIGIAALFVLAAMTVYKQFYGFMYSSYSEALQNASMSQGFSYNLMDAYFYGIDTISKNIHYGQLMDVGVGHLFYDFFRNLFGLSFFIPGGRLLVSQMYNSIIYSGDQLTGLLLSSVGYGYIFTGYSIAPLITVINVVMMLFFEKCLRKSKTIEWQYIWAFVFMRFGFGVLGSTPPLINLVTRFIVINAIIIGFARLFKINLQK